MSQILHQTSLDRIENSYVCFHQECYSQGQGYNINTTTNTCLYFNILDILGIMGTNINEIAKIKIESGVQATVRLIYIYIYICMCICI